MIDIIGSSIIGIGSKIIDKVFPDTEKYALEREKAKLELIKAQQEGDFKELETRMSAIIEEAKSDDPWTSRARPSFLYVMYTMILFSIPMGFINIYNPETALHITDGMTSFLNKIPESLYELMMFGYLGYTGSRTYEKVKKVSK